MTDQIPTLEQLIKSRNAHRLFHKKKLVHKMGYRHQKISKGMRHIDRILERDFDLAAQIAPRLAQGFDMTEDEILKSIARSVQFIEEEYDRAYRENFKPHAIALSPSKIPSPIFIYAMAGGASRRHISFPEGLHLSEYHTYASANLPDFIPGMQPPNGFVVNYSPDFAIEYGKNGELIRLRDKAYQMGQAYMKFGGSKLKGKIFTNFISNLSQGGN